MEDIKALLQQVKAKAEKAAARVQMLESENDTLKAEVEKLKSDNEALKREAVRLKESKDILRIAGAVSDESGNRSSKQKIAELVREIDHCIMLLK